MLWANDEMVLGFGLKPQENPAIYPSGIKPQLLAAVSIGTGRLAFLVFLIDRIGRDFDRHVIVFRRMVWLFR